MEHRQHISYLNSCALCIFIQIKKEKRSGWQKKKTEDDVDASCHWNENKTVERYKFTYACECPESTRCLHSPSRHHSICMPVLAHFYPFGFGGHKKKQHRWSERKHEPWKIPNKFYPKTTKKTAKTNKMEKSYKILIYDENATEEKCF